MKIFAITVKHVILCLAILLPAMVLCQDLSELDKQRIQARQNFDLETSLRVFDDLQVFAKNSPSTESNLALAYAALAVAELQRIAFEEINDQPAQKREMGKQIDNSASIGLSTVDVLPDTSEKFRIQSDLYGIMIRSRYQGKKYGNKMDAASEKALELDSNNPDAHVTAAKKPLFAGEKHGGDIPMALTHLNAALALNPKHETALILRGTAYEKLSDFPAAKRDWDQVLTQNPLCKPALENLKYLESAQ